VTVSDVVPAVTSISSSRRMGTGEAVGGRVSSPQFVGRIEQLAVLKAAFDQISNGRTTTVLIGGDAGVGKTRLVEEFTTQVREEKALVATGVCVPTDSGGLPYAPIVGIVRDLLSQVDTAADVVGPVARGLGIDTSGAVLSVDEFAKTRLFESILTFVTKTAHEAPVVFVFEDLHWADSASAELLGYLVRNLTDARALIVVTYRAEEVLRDHPLHGWLTELTRHPRTTQLRLSGLDRDETATLIGAIIGQQPNWALADGVWARSQGNPFFAEELIAARDDPSLSPELQGVILSRVEALAKPTQQVLRVIATAGTTVTDRLVAALGVLDSDALDLALAEAVDRQILVVDASVAGYRFRHALLREAVYAAMLPGETRRLHRALATTLTADPSLGASGPGYRVAELAGHWWAAGEWPEALAASLAAADAAEAVWAFPEALAHLEHALSALDRLPGEARTDRVELLAKVSEVAHLAGAGQRAVELARAALDSSDAAVDPFSAARYYTLLGRNLWALGESQAAFDAYRTAAALLPTDPPSVELAGIIAEEARWLMLVARNGESEARCHEAIAVARAVGARGVEGHALNTLGVCRADLGHPDDGIRLLRDALTIALEVGNAWDLDRAFINLGHVLTDWGDLEGAVNLVLESRVAGEQRGFPRLNGVVVNGLWALVRLSRYEEAEAMLASWGRRGVGTNDVAPQLIPAIIAIRRGRLDEAARMLADVERSTVNLNDIQTRGLLYMEVAELAIERGLPDDAYAAVERALALVTATDDASRRAHICALGVHALADRLADDRARGRQADVDTAQRLAADLIQEANRPVDGGAGSRAPQARACIAMAVAEQSRLTRSDALLWADAVSLWEAAHEPYRAADCQWRQAEALLENRVGRREAADCLQAAFATASRIGAIPLRTRIEQLAQRARITLSVDLAPAASSADSLGLTPREMEILGQLADGLSDREIAEALFISKKTASVHVSNVLHKLDVSNRVEAGRVGQAHGLGTRGTPAPAAVH
jgi:DNA-binding CsgD family transcriptional regulator